MGDCLVETRGWAGKADDLVGDSLVAARHWTGKVDDLVESVAEEGSCFVWRCGKSFREAGGARDGCLGLRDPWAIREREGMGPGFEVVPCGCWQTASVEASWILASTWPFVGRL